MGRDPSPPGAPWRRASRRKRRASSGSSASPGTRTRASTGTCWRTPSSTTSASTPCRYRSRCVPAAQRARRGKSRASSAVAFPAACSISRVTGSGTRGRGRLNVPRADPSNSSLRLSALYLLTGVLAPLLRLRHQLIRNVVLEDVGDVGDRLLPDLLRHHVLHVLEPAVGVEPAFRRLLPQRLDAVGPGIVGGERKERFHHRIQRRLVEVGVLDMAQVLHP